MKNLASLATTPNARAQQVQSDTEKRAYDLDLMYPGSMFTQVLKAHGPPRRRIGGGGGFQISFFGGIKQKLCDGVKDID